MLSQVVKIYSGPFKKYVRPEWGWVSPKAYKKVRGEEGLLKAYVLT